MNFDRNTIIGFVLMMLLLFGYIFYSNKQGLAVQKEKKRLEDSAAQAQASKKKIVDTVQFKKDSAQQEIKNNQQAAAGFAPATTEQITVVENEVMKIGFTNKGGYPKYVELKNFNRYDSTKVTLGGEGHGITYQVVTGVNQSANTSQLNFVPSAVEKKGDDQVIRFKAADSTGKFIEHIFTVKKSDYLINWDIKFSNAAQFLTQGLLNINWDIVAHQQERELKYEKSQSNIAHFENGSYDFSAAGTTGDTKKFGDKTKWIGIKQQFFNTTILAVNNVSSAETKWTVPTEQQDSLKQVLTANTIFRFNLGGVSEATVPLQMYYGPNDYHILKTYENGMSSHVQLGYGIFAFVKYINRWVVMPVFDFFKNHIGSIGIVIMLLTFIIRLIISPLTYTSYLSGAKMRVLRPDIEELKKKYGDDQQAMSMEQMKLFRSAGVNPLAGCIPAVLQIPIFFALYSFFNANLALRGESFLWSHDLSAFDSIAHLPFKIPFYGDHVSLFTITATITSFLISMYNMQTTPTQDNPVMKYMIYFFPIMLLFFFNSLPSALTWYYTVSNLVTLGLQFVIQKFIISDEKIHAKIQENKKKPASKSKWQEKLEQIQNANQQSSQKVKDMQNKAQGKK
ncbi:MAG: membrane protein insertase YidC [Chitinophagaceae bacterium]|nr:membrane protein insertase YidC [Chitinophagaceae bacterium]